MLYRRFYASLAAIVMLTCASPLLRAATAEGRQALHQMIEHPGAPCLMAAVTFNFAPATVHLVGKGFGQSQAAITLKINDLPVEESDFQLLTDGLILVPANHHLFIFSSIQGETTFTVENNGQECRLVTGERLPGYETRQSLKSHQSLDPLDQVLDDMVDAAFAGLAEPVAVAVPAPVQALAVPAPVQALAAMAQPKARIRERKQKPAMPPAGVAPIMVKGLSRLGDRSILRDGVRVDLSEMEGRFMNLLAAAPGQQVEVETIRQTLWGEDAGGTKEAVAILLSSLRTKLHKVGGPKFLGMTHGAVKLSMSGWGAPQSTPGAAAAGLPSLTWGDLARFADTRSVCLNGQPVRKLSEGECKVLAALVRNQGAITTYNELRGAVWEQNAPPETSQKLASLIFSLRRKLEPNPSNPKYLLNVAHQGYKLEIPKD